MVIFVKAIYFLIAAIFIAMIALANTACPLLHCNGPEGDGWMLPFLFALFGLPALIASIVFVAMNLSRLGGASKRRQF